MEAILLFLGVIAVNLVLLKMKIPLLEFPVGIFTIVYCMLNTDLPYFPYINLIGVIFGIGLILDSIDQLQ